MLLGLGYLPSRSGTAFWQRFDASEIAEDLAHIATLGFQAVRVPLFWSDFQPGLERIAPRVLDHFGRFLDLCQHYGLRVRGGLWAGMWDGALWWPEWGVAPAPLPPSWPVLVNGVRLRWGRVRQVFNDERMLAARQVLVRELVGFFRDHPALLGWEPLPGFGRLAAASERSIVLEWLHSSIESLNQAAPALRSTFLLALDALETRAALWPDEIVAAGGEPSLSVATFASDRRRLPLNARWIAFALDLTAVLAGRPLMLHLAGLPTAPAGQPSVALDGVFYANEDAAAAHLANVLALARQRNAPELWLWRWADVPEQHWDEPPYDRSPWRRHTGLLRADGSEKKLLEGLRATSNEEFPVLAIDPDDYRADPANRFQGLWYDYQKLAGANRQ